MSALQAFFDYSVASIAFQTMRAATVAIVGGFAIYAIRAFLKRRISKVYHDPLRVNAAIRLLTYILIFILFTIVLHEFNINVSTLVGAAGVVSLAIGLASQTSISNIVSGIFIILYHPFDLEDQVTINAIDGKVKEVSLFAVTLRTLDNRLVRIPNEQVIKSNIINLSKEPYRGFQATIDLAAESDIESAIKVINTLAQSKEYLLAQPAPSISVLEINGGFSRLIVVVWCKQEEWLRTRRQFLIDLKQALEQANIQLSNPSTMLVKQ